MTEKEECTNCKNGKEIVCEVCLRILKQQIIYDEELVKKAIEEVNQEQKEEIGHITFAKLVIEKLKGKIPKEEFFN